MGNPPTIGHVPWSEERCRAIVVARSGGRCEAAIPGVCLGAAASIHHRVKRSRGGTWAPSNLLHVCGDGTIGCHGWIEHHPKQARYEGLDLPAGADTTTETVHARWECHYAWWFLDNEGTFLFDDSELEPVRLSWAAVPFQFEPKPSR